jgi:hypothetical protein
VRSPNTPNIFGISIPAKSKKQGQNSDQSKDVNRQFFWVINETKNPEPTSDPLAQAIAYA